MYYVYLLKSLKTGKKYIGYTNNLARRIIEHNRSSKGFSLRNKPFRLVKAWKSNEKKKATNFEKYLKKLKGGNGLKKFLNSY